VEVPKHPAPLERSESTTGGAHVEPGPLPTGAMTARSPETSPDLGQPDRNESSHSMKAAELAGPSEPDGADSGSPRRSADEHASGNAAETNPAGNTEQAEAGDVASRDSSANVDEAQVDDSSELAEIDPADLEGKTKDEIREYAREKGLRPVGQPDADGEPRKWKYSDTNEDALRIDSGHVDKKTGEPFDLPNAAVPHVHAYDRSGNALVGPVCGDRHIPLKE
jgi:hypothetical protein